ncbi:MAG: PIN domain-containing protein [Nostoc sp. DedSLP03]|uniref:type II toxin-antitoxin system VapC family toxin n=1 Tax=Nostoc sp. DedSLP03 TaxID=3075400 RepID=UPI002AD36424|nr:PIN domain-containing protein [Nostoc sp. DedSLP03]MDZ7969845.1 PIN domain-containing protein [Nostoc sp. DedSLP03]
MNSVFVDTFYWIALANPRDAWHVRTQDIHKSLMQRKLITTDEVLTEFVNYFSTAGRFTRSGIFQLAQSILQNDRVQVIPQTRESFLGGLALYSQRFDKGYSLTDCISMHTMRQLEIIEVLTHDKHFTQEGFAILLSD